MGEVEYDSQYWLLTESYVLGHHGRLWALVLTCNHVPDICELRSQKQG